ncbi:hypothetical protein lerEdw1_007038 [Lerista edwardsae]|nr:hypothetical protein lerEdw1_007038 [Lerista edwardsae]
MFLIACFYHLVFPSYPLDYPISLFYVDSRLSTLIWFRPAYCLYEQWRKDALDPSQASRKMATIEVEVKPAGVNGTYKILHRFPIPLCGPLLDQDMLGANLVYEMGPILACLDDTCTKTVLPDHGYSVRYCIYNQAQNLLAVTNWSRPFYTRGMPRSFRSIDVDSRSPSIGLVMVIVLLSITVFFLLTAVWAARSGQRQ